MSALDIFAWIVLLILVASGIAMSSLWVGCLAISQERATILRLKLLRLPGG
jgi:hypothetical protein